MAPLGRMADAELSRFAAVGYSYGAIISGRERERYGRTNDITGNGGYGDQGRFGSGLGSELDL